MTAPERPAVLVVDAMTKTCPGRADPVIVSRIKVAFEGPASHLAKLNCRPADPEVWITYEELVDDIDGETVLPLTQTENVSSFVVKLR